MNDDVEAIMAPESPDLSGEWQSGKWKAEVLAHPLYEQLLAAHVACLRIATPVDQLPRINAQLTQSQQVVAKYSALANAAAVDDKDLDQFMVVIIFSYASLFTFFPASLICSNFNSMDEL